MELMLCKTGDEKLLDNPNYAAELKADGTHVRATKHEGYGIPKVFGRPKKTGTPEYTDSLPDLVDAVKRIPGDFEIVGEAVVYDENGRTWFEGSQRRCSTQDPAKVELYRVKYPVMLLAFDITELDGEDLKRRPYEERKQILYSLLQDTEQDRVTPLPHVIKDKRGFFNELVERGEEGVILKRLGTAYTRTRSEYWLKVKQWHEERVKIVGFTPGTGKRASYFGSLILAKLEDNGTLRYRGKVGSGFNDVEVRSIYEKLKASIVEKGKVEAPDTYTPTDLPLEVTVRFFEATKNDVLRFPTLMKDSQGNNLIHYESTIDGAPSRKKQLDLKAILEGRF